MESYNAKNYQELQNIHLSMLMQYGRGYASVIVTGIGLLSQELNDTELSEDAKEMLDILKKTAQKQIELLDLVLEEQQNFLKQHPPSGE